MGKNWEITLLIRYGKDEIYKQTKDKYFIGYAFQKQWYIYDLPFKIH